MTSRYKMLDGVRIEMSDAEYEEILKAQSEVVEIPAPEPSVSDTKFKEVLTSKGFTQEAVDVLWAELVKE